MAPNNSETASLVKEATALTKTDPPKAEALFHKILSAGPGSTESTARDYETALVALGELYRDQKRPNELGELLKTSRSSFSSFAKAKSAKLGAYGPIVDF